MEDNKKWAERDKFPQTDPEGQKPEQVVDWNNMESDDDALEPSEFGTATGSINADDPKDLAYWAEQLQIGQQELKAAILVRGSEIADIKKYLRV